jgi:hypothetical protein
VVISASIANTVKAEQRSCAIVDRKYFFIIFSLKKFSALQFVDGVHNKIRKDTSI